MEHRFRLGDLEIDTIVGKNHQQSLVSIVDRKTVYLWLRKCNTRKAEEISKATISLLSLVKDQLKIITADNGKDFNLHEHIAQLLNLDWYFSDPYSAWQRGINENTNGLVKYIRKGSDLNDYGDKYIAEITQRLNQRPKKDSDLKARVRYYVNNIVLYFKR
ncbi:IS30 family transposase [Acinetobacter lanii]